MMAMVDNAMMPSSDALMHIRFATIRCSLVHAFLCGLRPGSCLFYNVRRNDGMIRRMTCRSWEWAEASVSCPSFGPC